MADIAKAYVQIIPSAEGMKQNLTKALGGDVESAGTDIGKSLVSKIKNVIVAAGIGKVITDSIKTAIGNGAELQQNLGGTEAVFGDFSANIQRSAQDAYKNMGLSASDYMATANKMGSLFQGSGIEQQKSLELTQNAMQRAADVASVMGLDMQMAMDSIAGAAKGNFTMMDNLGVAMNATTLQAYALEKGVNFKWDTASNAEKAELAMQMFMDRTLQYEGNFARESADTISGSLGAMQAAAQDFMGNLALGEDIQGPLSNLLQTTETFLFGNLLPAIANIFKALPGALKQAITQGIPTLISSGQEIIQSLSSGIVSGIPQLLNKGLPVLLQFTQGLRSNFGKLVDAGIDFIMNIVNGIVQGMPALIEYVPQIISNIAGLINDNAPKLFMAAVNIIVTLAKGIWDNRQVIMDNMGNIVKMVIDVIQAINWLDLGSKVIKFIGQGIRALFNLIPNLMKQIGESGFNLIKNTNWTLLGKTVINFILNGIKALASMIPNLLKSIAQLGFNLIKSVDWIGLGRTVVSFIKDGINGLFTQVPNLLKSIGSSGLNLFKSIDWANLGRSVINLISGGISALASIIPNALRSIGSAALSAFSGIDWSGMGSSIINGIVSGIKSAGHLIKETLLGFAQSAWNAAKSFFKIGSPSKLMADTIGKQIPAGVAVGIYKGMDSVTQAMTELGKVTTGSYAMELSSSKYSMRGSQFEETDTVQANGFTQNITVNSPTELSPSEVARQTRIATKQMALAIRGV